MRLAYQISLSDPECLDYVMWQNKPMGPWLFVLSDGSVGRRRMGVRLRRGPRHVSCIMPHVQYRGPRPKPDHPHAYYLDFAVHASSQSMHAGIPESLVQIDGSRITFTDAGADCIRQHTLPSCFHTTQLVSDAL